MTYLFNSMNFVTEFGISKDFAVFSFWSIFCTTLKIKKHLFSINLTNKTRLLGFNYSFISYANITNILTFIFLFSILSLNLTNARKI